ncbi:MAG: UDP-2,3-diacylglucosamine diphosphatase, partial [Bacteroidota bacterium]|nr:UDP-2,3-diacylglucosamine diphosphatase [Bacteroidota bacterium]
METTTLQTGKKIYFASDFHLGIPDYASSLVREKKIVRWLDTIKEDAQEIFLLGDIFDFWFEYKTVVPKGFIRFLGKITELADKGIIIHLFRGNHDIWAFDYFSEECNVHLHREPKVRNFNNTNFLLAHGDGLGPGDKHYKFMKSLFENKLLQWAFKWIHPDIGTRLGLYSSHQSRLSNIAKENKLDKELSLNQIPLYHYTKEHLVKNPDINYYIYGHYHMIKQEKLNNSSEFIL